MSKFISKVDKREFLHIKDQLVKLRANFCKQEEMASYLEISVRKLSDFESGKNFDFWLMTQYANILQKEIIFDLL